MTEKMVDARGMICPRPLILTKKALSELEIGRSIKVLIDNETSRQNVERFLKDNGARVVVAVENGVFILTVTRLQDDIPSPDAASYCVPLPQARPHVIAISSNTMGRGPDDLGGILIKAFVNTIKEVNPLPAAVVFYSSGVLLTVDGSPLVEPIRELQSHGVTVLICGTCADYYGKKQQISVGTISNMYTILETLTAAGHVITP